MTLSEMLRDLRAESEARRQYAKAVDAHFEEAHRLVAQGLPDAAELVAKGAVALRMDARYELRGE